MDREPKWASRLRRYVEKKSPEHQKREQVKKLVMAQLKAERKHKQKLALIAYRMENQFNQTTREENLKKSLEYSQFGMPGSVIENSNLFRGYCASCKTPIRVTSKDLARSSKCNQCEGVKPYLTGLTPRQKEALAKTSS